MKNLFLPLSRAIRNHPIWALSLTIGLATVFAVLNVLQEDNPEPLDSFHAEAGILEQTQTIHETHFPEQETLFLITPNEALNINHIQPDYTQPLADGYLHTFILTQPDLTQQLTNHAETNNFPYYTQAAFNTAVEEEAQKSFLLSLSIGLVFIALILLFMYGNVVDTVLTLLGLGITLAATTGMQALLGPAYLGILKTSTNPLFIVIPVLLLSLTVDYALQVKSHYREELRRQQNTKEAMQQAVLVTGTPLLLSALTTALAFLVNAFSPIPAIRDTSIMAFIGIIFGYLIMTIFVTSCKVLIDRQYEIRGRPRSEKRILLSLPWIAKAFSYRARAALKHPIITIGIVVLLAGGTIAALPHMVIEEKGEDYLKEDHPLLAFEETVEDTYPGTIDPMVLIVRGSFHDEDFLQALFTVEEQLTNLPGVVGPSQQSILRLAQANNWNTQPTNHYEAHQLYEKILKAPGSERVLNPAGYALIVLPYQGDLETNEAFLEQIENLNELFGTTTLLPLNNEVASYHVSQDLAAYQMQSLWITLAAAGAMLFLYFLIVEKKPIHTLNALLPITAALIMILGYMALRGIPYNIVTSVITAIMVGVGLDYSIHLIHRYLEERKRHGIAKALNITLTEISGPLIASALTTLVGFSVLFFNPLTPFQQLAEVVTVGMLLILIATFILLPPLLVIWSLYHSWQARQKTWSKT